MKKMYKKNYENKYKAVLAFAVSLALILPGIAAVAYNEYENISRDIRVDTLISISPSSQNVDKNESFNVSVYVCPGEPIVGINFAYLYFDETIIQANSVTFDGFFEPYGTIDSQSIGLLEIDNVNGEIRYVFEGILGGGSVSANGSFVTINFTAQGEDGVSLLELDGVEILDPDTNQVPTTINNGTVIVGEPQNNPPYEPSEPNPEDGAGEVSVDADLSWTGGDPDGDPVTYDVYFGTTSPPPLVVSGQSETSYDPGTMNYETQYYWKIVSWDNHGASNTSDEWDFTTEILNEPPNEPSDPNPEDGETGVSIDADLSWTGGDPNPGDIVTYDVYFGTTSPPPQVVWGQSDTTYDPGTMTPNTQYSWKIVSWDNHGASNESPIWNFATENRPPNVPSDPDPYDGETDVDVDHDLRWAGGDPDPGDTVTYDVYFGTTSPPPQVVWGQSGIAYDPGTMNPNTQYYWRIVSWDSYGASTSGPEWDFTTENNPPYEPSNPSPSDGETGVLIDADLSWTGGDPDPGDTVTYDVYFGTTSPPPQVVTGQSETTYDPPGTMNYNTQYYWQIISWDNHGASTTGPIWDFTTEEEPEPDLDCDGVLYWEDVEYGETVTGSFTVENIGDPGSLLDWEIESYPDRGTWTFTPDSGVLAEGDSIEVQVEVIAPDEGGELTGDVKIVNSEDPSDSCTISVTMRDAVSQQSSLLLRFLERLIQWFPMLERILSLFLFFR